MANYKKALKQLTELNNANTEEGKVRERDLKGQLSYIIVDKYFNKQDKKWTREFAKQILEEKKKKENKKC